MMRSNFWEFYSLKKTKKNISNQTELLCFRLAEMLNSSVLTQNLSK